MSEQSTQSARRLSWPSGAVIFSLALALAMTGYAYDVMRKARGLADWIMILPAAIIGIIALLISIGEDVIAARRPAVAAMQTATEEALQTYRGIVFMALLAAYVAGIPYAGFDLSTFLFLVVALFIQGERRLWFCLLFSALVTAPTVLIFVHLLGVRMHTIAF